MEASAYVFVGVTGLQSCEIEKMSKKRSFEGDSVYVCPIVYGSVAHPIIGRKTGDSATHRWTLYVRGPNGEDLSTFLEKVVFTLHVSFEKPVREIFSPPYEVTEVGWGEFEAGITLHFKAPPVDNEETLSLSSVSAPIVTIKTEKPDNEICQLKPVLILHWIRLYPLLPPGTVTPPSTALLKKSTGPVVIEQYDEVVFKNPPLYFRGNLMQYWDSASQIKETPENTVVSPDLWQTFPSESDGIHKISVVQNHIQQLLTEAKAELHHVSTILLGSVQKSEN